MSTAAKIVDPRVMTIKVTGDEIIAHLVDGRTISVPLVWSWRLTDASREQRQHWEILGHGRVYAGQTLTRIGGQGDGTDRETSGKCIGMTAQGSPMERGMR